MLALTNKRTAVGFIIVCVALMLPAIHGNAAQSSPCLPATTTALEMNRVIYQEFPARGPTETAWKIVWSELPEKGLWIENAWFTPKPGATPILVLGQSGLSNIFVPYHDGLGSHREYDLNQWTVLREAVLAYTGPCGTISGPALPDPSSQALSQNSPPRPVLIKEIRDRGVAWTSNGHLRRGEELLLWSVIDTGNYEYIIQYGFRDDGTITFRMGSTGYNYPTTVNMAYEPHMHNALWHLDINLGHYDHNSVSVMKHLEPDPFPSTNPSSSPMKAIDVMDQINNGLEGYADWKAEEFTGLNIMDTLTTNARGHNISYDLMPMRTGTARHDEVFTQHDFWVTHQNANELTYEYGFTAGPPFMPYITEPQPESITDTDVVIWYMSSNHHLPRDEDHEFDAQGNWKSGIAQVMWSGFDLQPRNLMDDAPLFGCAQVPQGIVAWWPFEEVSGSICVVDISGGGLKNNGTPHPGPLGPTSQNPTWTGPTPVFGAVGGALSFDGVDDYVEINDDPSLNFGLGDFSVDSWIKAPPNSSGVTSVILDKRTSAGMTFQGYNLYLFNGKLGLQLANGTTFANYTSNVNVCDAYWHHFAVTVNRTSGVKEIRWYVDGNHVDTTPAPLTGSLTNTSPLRLGSRSFQTGGLLKAVLGETELFSRVLTPAEIHDIYAMGKCRSPGPPPPCCIKCQ